MEVKTLRRRLNMTQAEFAVALRVSVRSVGGWEAGRKPIAPYQERIDLLARHTRKRKRTAR